MATADPAVQHALLDLAEIDRSMESARHLRESLPELAVIADGAVKVDDLRGREVLAQTEVDDLDRAARKLDDEIDAVRARSDRDQERLATGAVPPKELEGLQSEIESLARRQATLEDEALELMEQRETADGALSAVQVELAGVTDQIAQATTRRDDQFADIDLELGTLASRRSEVVDGIPADVLAIYDRVRSQGKVAAAALRGDTCEACRMGLDRVSLEEIRLAPPESIQRCPECSAILVRLGA